MRIYVGLILLRPTFVGSTVQVIAGAVFAAAGSRVPAQCGGDVVAGGAGGPITRSIAEFRRMHSQALTESGAELVRLARAVGLVKGETVAVDGSKFRNGNLS